MSEAQKQIYSQDFLEHASVCTSQYDSTCRGLATELLASRAEVKRLRGEVEQLRDSATAERQDAFFMRRHNEELEAEVARLKAEIEDDNSMVREVAAEVRHEDERRIAALEAEVKRLRDALMSCWGYASQDVGSGPMCIRETVQQILKMYPDQLRAALAAQQAPAAKGE